MTQEILKNSMTASDNDERGSSISDEIPTIRILFYTDDPKIVLDPDNIKSTDIDFFSIGRMREHIKAHAPAFAKLSFMWVSRSSDKKHHADHKLDDVLSKKPAYDQIWFFGIHQMNKEPFTLGIPKGGGPQSELDANEVAVLERWMETGGVLMTGAHANPHPKAVIPPKQDEFCPPSLDHKTFMSLGRALGHLVPRARLLRQWEGPPTRCVEDSFNTQVLSFGTNLEHTGLEIDATPQQLVLATFDPMGKPVPGGQPHPLFIDKRGQWIQVFPDHTHEGAVIIPEQLDKKEWPEGNHIQPEPRVVAYGMDKRNGRRLKIVAAYNGDSAGVGRIVADSTWHHYFNVNLTNFPPNAGEGSAADQIGQYYGNLAVWLSPLKKRQEMAHAMFWWLASHPLMVEEISSGVLNIGRTAYHILSRVASSCEIHELLQAASPKAFREHFEMLYFPERESVLGYLPSKELILGCVIDGFHRTIAEVLSLENTDAQGEYLIDRIIAEGFNQAFSIRAKTIKDIAVTAQDYHNKFCQSRLLTKG